MAIRAHVVITEREGSRPGKRPLEGSIHAVHDDDAMNAIHGCYLRGSRVVGMPKGQNPYDGDDSRAIFSVDIDDEGGHNGAIAWIAFSTMGVAEAWVKDRQRERMIQCERFTTSVRSGEMISIALHGLVHKKSVHIRFPDHIDPETEEKGLSFSIWSIRREISDNTRVMRAIIVSDGKYHNAVCDLMYIPDDETLEVEILRIESRGLDGFDGS